MKNKTKTLIDKNKKLRNSTHTQNDISGDIVPQTYILYIYLYFSQDQTANFWEMRLHLFVGLYPLRYHFVCAWKLSSFLFLSVSVLSYLDHHRDFL